MAAHIGAWLDHAWLRLRRMDYWNSAHLSGNLPSKVYRRMAPSSNTGANLMKHVAVGTSNFSVRYYNRMWCAATRATTRTRRFPPITPS